MVVVVIVGVLAGVSVPAFQDYVIRARAAEAFSLSAQVRATVEEHFNQRGAFPRDNGAAGLVPPAQLSGTYVESIEIDPVVGVLPTSTPSL